MIQPGPMKYKTFLKVGEKDAVQCVHDQVLMRCIVLFEVLVNKEQKGEVAERYQMSRNTVSALCKMFFTKVPVAKQALLYEASHVTEALCSAYLPYLAPGSRTPRSHPKQATIDHEAYVRRCWEEKKWKYGAQRLWNTICWNTSQEDPPPLGLTREKIRGILRRLQLKKAHLRTKKGPTRPLYDYALTPCLTHLHYDTKDLADQKSLPEPVYEHLVKHGLIPKVQWNIYDPISRLRFLAYSKERSATFGKLFLLFVLMRIRSLGHYHPLTVYVDGGVEFCSASEKKLQEWNQYLAPLDTTIIQYSGARDTRKNAIERTHRSDDEEFLIPHVMKAQNTEEFMQLAEQWHTTWNTTRSHQGHAMNGRTPLQQLLYRKVMHAPALVSTPVLHLNHMFPQLLTLQQYYQFFSQLKTTTLPFSDQKTQKNFFAQFQSINPHFAQNVLHSYQMEKKERIWKISLEKIIFFPRI